MWRTRNLSPPSTRAAHQLPDRGDVISMIVYAFLPSTFLAEVFDSDRLLPWLWA